MSLIEWKEEFSVGVPDVDHEHRELIALINQIHDRLEASIKQSLRIAASQGGLGISADPAAHANLIMCFIVGRWQQYAKSGFKRLPTELWQQQGPLLLG